LLRGKLLLQMCDAGLPELVHVTRYVNPDSTLSEARLSTGCCQPISYFYGKHLTYFTFFDEMEGFSGIP
jgi:hypothetical protein